MPSASEQFAMISQRLDVVQSKVNSLTPTTLIYAATGETIFHGCKVAQGESALDFTVTLKGLVAGDESRHNPHASSSPTRPFQYPNIASLKDGAFTSADLTAVVSAPPASGLARYDVAYIYVGPSGAGFAVATGTPGAGVKTGYTANGLLISAYDELTDAAIPLGAFPVARIYVGDDSSGIADANIADIRNFSGRLRGEAFVYNDLTATQKNELASGAIVDVTALADAAALSAAAASADADQTALDRVATGQDRIATAADVLLIDADRVAAASSASTATTQAGISTTQAGISTTQAGISTTQAGTATTQAGIATVKASEAAASAASIVSDELLASTKANEASASATASASSATASASSATASASSESAAASSATDAAVSRQVAQDSAALVQTVYDSFDDRYLGAKVENPLVDNDGNALIVGAFYFNSTVGSMRVWTGVEWRDDAELAEAAAIAAAASQSSAAVSASTATTQAGISTTQAGISTTQATEAAASAATSAEQATISITKAGESAASAATSTTQAGESAASAATSTTQAGAATAKAGEAASSATTATTKANESATSAANSASSATNADASELAAENSKLYAAEWANKAENLLVGASAGGDLVDDYSALHHAKKAAAASANAGTSATSSADSATAAGTSATNSAASAAASANSATNSASSETASATSASASDASKSYAAEWANKTADILVSVAAGGDGIDDYSALHHASKAGTSAEQASTSAANASTSATNASASATSSGASATSAEASNIAAASAASAASTSETNAGNSASAASASQTAAASSATNAATSETNANTSATSAAGSATAASGSSSDAQSSKNHATEWANKGADLLVSSAAGGDGIDDYSALHHATKAATSAASAANSASSMNASVTSAANSATAAENSATAASGSSATASTSAVTATDQKSYATEWANKAVDILVSTAAGGDGIDDYSALHYATKSAADKVATAADRTQTGSDVTSTTASKNAAGTSATNAANSETTAANSATNSANSAAAASTSEANSATSANAANAAKDATLAALDSFDDRYLGEKTADPTLDNDGFALVTGSLYFNPNEGTQGVMKVYTASGWLAAYADISGALVATANLSDLSNPSTARTNLGLGTAATTAATAYATAAQGTKADSALQPAAIGSTVQGFTSILAATTSSFTTALKDKIDSITAIFTSALKTKLDGIEPGAQVNVGDQFSVTGDYVGLRARATTAADVGLDQTNNTSDAAKPVSTAQQTAFDLKAPLASPVFTGTVTAPTFSGALSGNATSATTAASADAIDGIGFRNTGVNAAVAADTLDSNGITYVSGLSLLGQTDGALYSQVYSAVWQHQIYGDYRTGQLAVRGKSNDAWQAWRVVIDSSNYNSYAPTLTGGGASGSWGINVTGSAASTTGNAATVTNGVYTNVSYVDPSWLTSIASTKISGTMPLASLAGTYNIAITGNAETATVAGTITSQANSATITASSADVGNQIIRRDANGDYSARYAMLSYVNSVDDISSTGLTYLMGKFGDNYHRSADAAKVAAFISGQNFNTAGNAATATAAATATNVTWSGVTDKPVRANWDTVDAEYLISGELAWRNYGNSHTVIDNSNGVLPGGSSNAENPWVPTYPLLVGYNGANTYGVRVDSARVADSASAVAWSGVTSKPTTLAGFGITDAPTLSGAGATGSWGINVTGSSASTTGNAATVTNGVYTARTISAGTGLTGGGDLSIDRSFSVNYGTIAGTSAQGDDSRINNGQTAFGWGNHALAGYAASGHNHTGTYQPLTTVLTNTTASYTTALNTKLAGIAAGAEVNPAVVSQLDAEAGVATTEQTWTAQRVAQAIAAQAKGGTVTTAKLMSMGAI